MSLKETRRSYSEGNFQSLEASESLAQPSVIYDESLFNPEVPYTVTVDATRCGALFSDFGMSDDRIKELTVVAKRKDNFIGLQRLGHWEPKDKQVVVATDWIWDTYQKCVDLVDKVAHENTRPFRDKFGKLLRTKNTDRFYDYLSSAPSERAVPFADRLLSEGMNREMNALFLHEAKHAIDSTDKILSLKHWLTFAGMLVTAEAGFYLVNKDALASYEFEQAPYLIDFYSKIDLVPTIAAAAVPAVVAYIVVNPKERSARKFEKLHKHDPRWHYLVTIKSKE